MVPSVRFSTHFLSTNKFFLGWQLFFLTTTAYICHFVVFGHAEYELKISYAC
jgi:hypothetical protein